MSPHAVVALLLLGSFLAFAVGNELGRFPRPSAWGWFVIVGSCVLCFMLGFTIVRLEVAL